MLQRLRALILMGPVRWGPKELPLLSPQGAPGNETKPSSANAAGTGGGEGAKAKPEKTP